MEASQCRNSCGKTGLKSIHQECSYFSGTEMHAHEVLNAGWCLFGIVSAALLFINRLRLPPLDRS